jgi:cobaltochelatase CobS
MSTNDGKITCMVCGGLVHSIQQHLKEAHPTMSLQDYQAKFPDEPILSETAKAVIAKHQAEKAAAAAGAPVEMAMSAAAVATTLAPPASLKKAFHELFGFEPTNPLAMSASKQSVMITYLEAVKNREMVPVIDPEYVFDVQITKNICLAVELGIPAYIWGHAGTGKTTLVKQVAARTNRPTIRVQHTINTEEAHIIGQWVVKHGETVYQLGPLPQAMLNGWAYIADEYDFALPSVLSVYQPVLEGEPLFIKDAPPEMRLIKPHKDFRFFATGNTNGGGDDSGLYQGTSIQNSANYERFGMVERVNYLEPATEQKIIINRSGVAAADAKKLVEFAKDIRASYERGALSATISPRSLIFAANFGVRRGSYRIGLNLAFINRLNKVDREVCDGIAFRIFGAA